LWTGQRRVLTGHEGPINGALVLDADGVLSWGEDGSLFVWNLATGEAARRLLGHQSPVRGVLMLPDGRPLSWDWDGGVHVWDLATGESLSLRGHKRFPDVLLLDDGRPLSWDSGGTIRLWDVSTGEARVLLGHQGRIERLMLLPDSRALTWGVDRTLRLWKFAAAEEHCVLGENIEVHGAAVLPNDRVMTWGSSLLIWDLATRSSQLLTALSEWGPSPQVLSDGRALSWGLDGCCVWDLTTNRGSVVVVRHEVSQAEAQSLLEQLGFGAIVLSNGRVASVSGPSIRITDPANANPAFAFDFDGVPSVVACTPSGELLVADSLGRVHLLEVIDRS
jgi:WD40 repeat protein